MSRMPGPWFALSLASIAFVGPLAVHLFLPVIPAVKAALDLSTALAQLTFSMALFGMAFATLIYGALADRYGRRPVLLSGLCLFLLGSVLSAAADTVGLLVVGRLVQALGAGCGVTLVRTIARDAYGPERLVKAIAYLTMFYTFGPMIAPVVGGVLVDTLGWRSVFGFAIVVGGVITAGAYAAIYETRPPGEGGGAGVWRGYATLFADARFTAFVLQSGFSTGAFMVLATASSSLMHESLGRPATEFGVYFLLFPVGYFFGNLISSRIGNRVAIETMVLAGSILSAAAVAVLAALLLSGHSEPLAIFLPGFFLTVGQGISLPYAQAGAMGTAPYLAGTAAGVGVFMQHFCGAAFAQLYGLVANGRPGPMIAMAAASAALGLLAAALPFCLRRRNRKV
jgi:DHA1 family bicyclomycin/chloramphenicol resistance-like MFS transporter